MLESPDMIPRLLACLTCLLLTACGNTPALVPDPETAEPVPELTLNLPPSDCSCQQEQQDYTFLEKGFKSLEAGEYLESLQYFQRYQRIEKTATADAEARIAIAYLSMLAESPILDREAAAENYASVRREASSDLELHEKILLMRASLETFLELQQQVDRLKQSNSNLRLELEKREDAINRLRDLTLGRESEPAGLLGK
jgi:hypothetical protein